MQNAPQGRKKNITGQGKPIHTNGPAQGQRPAGSQNGYAGRQMNRPSGPSGGGNRNNGSPQNRGGGKMPLIILLLALLLGGGGGLSGLFGGSGGTTDLPQTSDFDYSAYVTATPRPTQAPAAQDGSGLGGLLELLTGGWDTGAGSTDVSSLSGLFGGSAYVPTAAPTATRRPTATPRSAATTKPTSAPQAAAGVRAPYTTLRGGGCDTVTLMVYMCGTDLESRSAMATRDLQEMLKASFGDNLRLIVLTGGCAGWRNNTIASNRNQIWQVRNGRLSCLVDNNGTAPMVQPGTLSDFIRYCGKNFPADRYGLIFWDHGSGSVSGYGYDEKNPRSGSMNLANIDKALTDGGLKFDFIGFDACLMATVENALMLNSHADYLIASEETEPGYGWYYTNWLEALGRNTSMPTVELGQRIVDDFVSVSAQQAAGQSTTLSVVDLAELSASVPDKLNAWARSISGLIEKKQYTTLSNARNGAREFAQSNRLDQVDLADLARRMGTPEGEELARALTGAVKYNRTSSNMRNAYGLSIYFPYQKLSNVDKAVTAYRQIGMDDSYITCIRQFASLELSGQSVSGGYTNPWSALTGSGGSQSAYGNADLLSELLGSFLGGNYGRVRGMDAGNTAFMADSALTGSDLAAYLGDHMIDPSLLVFTDTADGKRLRLPDDQAALVQSVQLNMFYEYDGGYIDLGLDGLYTKTEDGFIADTEGTWIAIGGMPVPYYELTADEDARTGYVPALLNGERVQLLISFTPDGQGYLVGARADYANGETETVAKSLSGLPVGATLQFICDRYTRDGQYEATYYYGDPVTVTRDTLAVSDVYIDASRARLTYRLTDIYNQEYWTEAYTIR